MCLPHSQRNTKTYPILRIRNTSGGCCEYASSMHAHACARVHTHIYTHTHTQQTLNLGFRVKTTHRAPCWALTSNPAQHQVHCQTLPGQDRENFPEVGPCALGCGECVGVPQVKVGARKRISYHVWPASQAVGYTVLCILFIFHWALFLPHTMPAPAATRSELYPSSKAQ